MPVYIPKARATEVLTFGAAGVAAMTPLCMALPGAEERLSAQVAFWAPRWERNITYMQSPVERGIKRITPPVAKTVQRIERRLPLEKTAKSVDRGIKKNLDYMGVKRS